MYSILSSSVIYMCVSKSMCLPTKHPPLSPAAAADFIHLNHHTKIYKQTRLKFKQRPKSANGQPKIAFSIFKAKKVAKKIIPRFRFRGLWTHLSFFKTRTYSVRLELELEYAMIEWCRIHSVCAVSCCLLLIANSVKKPLTRNSKRPPYFNSGKHKSALNKKKKIS